MWRVTTSIVLLASCRLYFDPLAAPSDATGDSSDSSIIDSVPDAPPDAPNSPVVQAVSFDVSGGTLIINAANGGLAPVTPGHMVMVSCGAPGGNATPCAPVSTPPAVWNQVDPGTTFGVYITCNAPAITSIQLTNGATGMMAVVTEWSGLVAAGCFDVKHISQPCLPAPSIWDSLATPVVSQNRELIVSVGQAGAVNAGWTVDAPYVMAKNATGVNSAANVYVAYQLVNATPMAYSSTGTINQWSISCFNDTFAFKAQ